MGVGVGLLDFSHMLSYSGMPDFVTPMGALEVEPVPAQDGIPDVVRHWHTTQGLDVLEPGFVEYPVEDAASLPGVVTKFSTVQDGRRYTVHRQGAAGSVILKLRERIATLAEQIDAHRKRVLGLENSFPLWGKAGMGASANTAPDGGQAPTPTLPQRGRGKK